MHTKQNADNERHVHRQERRVGLRAAEKLTAGKWREEIERERENEIIPDHLNVLLTSNIKPKLNSKSSVPTDQTEQLAGESNTLSVIGKIGHHLFIFCLETLCSVYLYFYLY